MTVYYNHDQSLALLRNLTNYSHILIHICNELNLNMNITHIITDYTSIYYLYMYNPDINIILITCDNFATIRFDAQHVIHLSELSMEYFNELLIDS